MTTDVLVKSEEVVSESCISGKTDYCTHVYIVLVYRLSADATSTPGVRLEMEKVCSVEFEAFKLLKRSLLSTFLAQFKLIANNENTILASKACFANESKSKSSDFTMTKLILLAFASAKVSLG